MIEIYLAMHMISERCLLGTDIRTGKAWLHYIMTIIESQRTVLIYKKENMDRQYQTLFYLQKTYIYMAISTTDYLHNLQKVLHMNCLKKKKEKKKK